MESLTLMEGLIATSYLDMKFYSFWNLKMLFLKNSSFYLYNYLLLFPLYFSAIFIDYRRTELKAGFEKSEFIL